MSLFARRPVEQRDVGSVSWGPYGDGTIPPPGSVYADGPLIGGDQALRLAAGLRPLPTVIGIVQFPIPSATLDAELFRSHSAFHWDALLDAKAIAPIGHKAAARQQHPPALMTRKGCGETADQRPPELSYVPDIVSASDLKTTTRKGFTDDFCSCSRAHRSGYRTQVPGAARRFR